MKLAEALQERSDINKRISELRRRLENCLLVQEGEEPAEDPMDLLNELDSSTERLETLVASINERSDGSAERAGFLDGTSGNVGGIHQRNKLQYKGRWDESDRAHCKKGCVNSQTFCV